MCPGIEILCAWKRRWCYCSKTAMKCKDTGIKDLLHFFNGVLDWAYRKKVLKVQLQKSLKIGFFCLFGRIKIKLRKCTTKIPLIVLQNMIFFSLRPVWGLVLDSLITLGKIRGISKGNRSILIWTHFFESNDFALKQAKNPFSSYRELFVKEE